MKPLSKKKKNKTNLKLQDKPFTWGYELGTILLTSALNKTATWKKKRYFSS